MKIFFLIIILIIALFLGANFFLGNIIASKYRYKGSLSDHFDGRRFFNQDKTPERGFIDILKWTLTRENNFWNKWTNSEPGPPPPLKVPEKEMLITFINHSTVLIQADNLNILTDPIWSDRASPLSFIGPQRHRPPGLRFEDLPFIHAVLISHNHYDHLDIATLKRLKDRFDPIFILPLGNKILLEENGMSKVIELDWWEDTMIYKLLKITLVPSKHFSIRAFCKRDAMLWGGYIIHTSAGPIYFAADTGFGRHFEQIYERFGPMRLALLPIGAYKPRWFMSPMHINPREAVLAHRILKAKTSIAIHFGTFKLGDDGEFDPVEDLKIALSAEKISPDEFIIPSHGIGYRITSLE